MKRSPTKNQIVAIVAGIFLSLSPSIRLRCYVGLSLVILVALLELVSIGAVIPFLALMTSSSANNLGGFLHPILSLFSGQSLYIAISGLLAAAVILSACMRLLSAWYSGRLSVIIAEELGQKCYYNILTQDLSYHLRTNSSELVALLIGKIDSAFYVFFGFFQFTSSIFVILFILFGLFYIDPVSSLTISVLGILTYGAFAVYSRRKLIGNSYLVSDSYEQSQKLLGESLSVIRETLLDKNFEYHIHLLSQKTVIKRESVAKNNFYILMPKFIIEGIAISGVVLFALGAEILNPGSTSSLLPIIGAFGLAFQKLLPSLQLGYSGSSLMLTHYKALFDIHSTLKLPSRIGCKDLVIPFERFV